MKKIELSSAAAGKRQQIARAASYAVESLERRLLLSVEVGPLPFGRVAELPMQPALPSWRLPARMAPAMFPEQRSLAEPGIDADFFASADIPPRQTPLMNPGSTTTAGTARSAGQLLISEILFNEIGPDVGGEWIEIYNAGPTSIDLSDYKLGDEETPGSVSPTEGMFQFPAGATIAAGEVQVVTNDAGVFQASYGSLPTYAVIGGGLVPEMRLYTPWDPDGQLINGGNVGDQYLLLGPSDEIVDAVSWNNPFAFDPPLPDSEADGQSWERIPAGPATLQDTNTAADWVLGNPSSPGVIDFPPALLQVYVDANAPAGGDGTSWGTAFTDLQAALAVAGDETTIFIADGTYKPTNGSDRSISFDLVAGVQILGGYAGFGAIDPNARDPDLYVTTLSGDIGIEGVNTDNSWHVVRAQGLLFNDALLDGLRIRGGYADGPSDLDSSGGGLLVISSELAVSASSAIKLQLRCSPSVVEASTERMSSSTSLLVTLSKTMPSVAAA